MSAPPSPSQTCASWPGGGCPGWCSTSSTAAPRTRSPCAPNREAFAALGLRPRVLVDVAERPQAVTVLGRVPPRVNARTGWDLVRHPRWLAGLVAHPRPTFANFTAMAPAARGTSGLAAYTNGLLNPGHTWRDLEWMVGRFDARRCSRG